MEEEAKKKDQKPAKKKVTPKKDPDRKPDYDEKEVPKVLKGPVAPDVMVVRKDYDAPMEDPGCGCFGPGPGPMPGPPAMPAPEPMVESPGGNPMMLLQCPKCQQQAPLEFNLPEGIPLAKLALQCFGCGEKIAFGSIVNQGGGMYGVAQ